jgi:hypothetical protein
MLDTGLFRAVKIYAAVSWAVALCSLVGATKVYTEDEGREFLQNVCTHLRD